MFGRSAFSVVLLIAGSLALAQTAPQTPTPAPVQTQTPTQINSTPTQRPLTNNFAMEAGNQMGRVGGSLLKATLSVPPDPAQAKLSQLSYIAVPEKEPKIMKKHDLVTIIIHEESSTTSKAQNDLKKNVELQAEIQQWFKLNLGKGSLYGLNTPTATPGLDVTGARTFHGEGELDRSDSIDARITAEVLDVKPNGTVILQARKHIKTDDDEQQFILTGICRGEDVQADNTVLSTQLFDMSLQKNSKGDVRESTRRGRLPKLLDWLNPF